MAKKMDEELGDWEELLTVENRYFIKRLFCHFKSAFQQGVFRWIIEKKEKVQTELIKMWALSNTKRSIDAGQFPAREIRISLN